MLTKLSVEKTPLRSRQKKFETRIFRFGFKFFDQFLNTKT